MRQLALVIVVVLLYLPARASDVTNVAFHSATGGDVVFSHDVHTRAAAISDNCTLCHDRIYPLGGKHTRRPVTMAQMEKGKSCGACHGRIAFSLKACGRCHSIKDVTFPVQPTGDVVFVHAPHTRNFACDRCHTRLFRPGRNPKATMADMERGKSCGACHRGKSAFPLAQCFRCHLAGKVTMTCVNAGPVAFSHEFHVKLYRCTDCHSKIFPLGYPNERPRATMEEMDHGKSCGACHDDYTAFTIRENCVRCHDM